MDPIKYKGNDSNLYRYVGNGPVHTVDPTGLMGKKGKNPQDPRNPDGTLKKWPKWVRALEGKPNGSVNDPGEIAKVKSVYPDKQHAGGRHFDVVYEDSEGNDRRQRFTPKGVAFTDEENAAIQNNGRTSLQTASPAPENTSNWDWLPSQDSVRTAAKYALFGVIIVGIIVTAPAWVPLYGTYRLVTLLLFLATPLENPDRPGWA